MSKLVALVVALLAIGNLCTLAALHFTDKRVDVLEKRANHESEMRQILDQDVKTLSKALHKTNQRFNQRIKTIESKNQDTCRCGCEDK